MKTEINKTLLPMKAHYFLFNAGTAPIVPFISIYARQIGFSSVTVGIFYTIVPICGMFAKPLFGAIADRFRAKKTVFLLSIFLVAVSCVMFLYVPELPVKQEIKFSCDESETFLDTCLGDNSTVSDQCAADNIQSQSGMTSCVLTCPLAEASYWDTICKHWNATKYCTNHPESLTFSAHLKLENTIQSGSCLYFKVSNITLDEVNLYPNCPNSENRIASVCAVTCESYTLNDLLTKPALTDSEMPLHYQYWWFLFLMIFTWVGQAVVVSVSDAICFDLLDNKPQRYGHQRMYGALGWGIFSAATGFMIDAFSVGQSKKDYTSAFYLAAALLVLNVIAAWRIQYSQTKLSHNIVKDVGSLLVDFRIFIYVLWCICVGLCTGLIWNFLFWLLEDLALGQGCDTYGRVKTLEGIVMAVQCLGGELPFFFFSGWILKRIGHVNAMSLVLLVFGLRYVLYSVIKNPWWFLPLEFSNGLSFALFFACMTSYASIVSPPGTEATVQGMVGAVFEGAGVSLGSFLGGYLYNIYGGPITFRIFGVGSLIACLVHAAVQYLNGRRFSGKEILAKYSSPKNAIQFLANSDEDQQEVKLVC